MSKSAVITVGRGRGFVVEGTFARYVVTPSWCLPRHEEDDRVKSKLEGFRLATDRLLWAAADPLRIFRNPPTPNWADLPPYACRPMKKPIYKILGALGEKASLSASCVFVDPISDVAVLSSPGDCEYDDEDSSDHYVALTSSVSPLATLSASAIRSTSAA